MNFNLKSLFKAIFAGKSHIKSRKPCQDYASYRLSKDGWLVMGLSDGAGGGRYAELGSKANVDAVLGLFQQITVNEFLQMEPDSRAETIINECVSYLKAEMLKYGIAEMYMEHLSATLLVAVITDKEIYIGHIGDGVVAARDKNGEFEFLSEPDNINGFSNRTHFTCEYSAKQYYHEKLFDPADYTSLVLCSDGPYNDIQASSESKLEEQLTSLMENVEQGVITNNIDFNRSLQQMGEIRDDWSVIALSLINQTVVEN